MKNNGWYHCQYCVFLCRGRRLFTEHMEVAHDMTPEVL